MKGGPILLVNIVIQIMLLFMPSLAPKAQLCTRVIHNDGDAIMLQFCNHFKTDLVLATDAGSDQNTTRTKSR